MNELESGGLRAIALTAVLLGASALIQCNDGASADPCPPCGAGTICNPAMGQCVVPPPPCSGASCGANASCGVGASCSCTAGWGDCNGDLGQPGGDGCECVPGTSTNSSTNTATNNATNNAYSCSVADLAPCGGPGRYCHSGSCADCPLGTFNCDGKGDCEDSEPCASNYGCVVNLPDDCGGATAFCEKSSQACKSCPPGMFNCDGTGECECNQACNGNTCDDLSLMSCTDIEIAYGEVLNDARGCNASAAVEECTLEVVGGLACGCTIFVNPAHTTEVHKLTALEQAWNSNGCKASCPPVAKCANPQRGICKANSKGGQCLY